MKSKKSVFSQVHGQGVLEFALVIPILILIIFAIFDVSRLIYHQSFISQIAKDDLRMVSLGKNINLISSNSQNMFNSIIGASTAVVSTGVDDAGSACTLITLTPLNKGNTVKLYITPVYTSVIQRGDTVRVSILYEMQYITPLKDILGTYTSIKSVCYTTMENSPK